MTVYVFVVESGNEEILESSFVDRKIDDIKSATYKENINIESMNEMIAEVSNRFQDSVFTVFVDSRYQEQYFRTPEGIEEHERIKLLETMTETVKVCRCNWMEFMFEFSGIDDSSNYIFMSSKNFKNVYEMAYHLQLPIGNNCYFCWNCDDITDAIDAKSYYNIFSSTKRIKQIDSLRENLTIDDEGIKWIIEDGVSQIKEMIKAGFLGREAFIQSFVEPWSINPCSYFSKGIIIEYGMKPKPPSGGDPKILKGLTVTELFNRSADYRYEILDRMMKIICKYGLEFGKITTINGNHQTVNFDFMLR